MPESPDDEWLVNEFHKLLEGVEWPEDTQTTPEQLAIYERATDILNTYRGHPDTLVEAMRWFLGTKSRPYAYAGAAQVMAYASFLVNDDFSAKGLDEAMGWLQKAQDITTDRPEINIIEFSIYIRMKRLDDARKVLDFLAEEETTTSFRICSAYLYYCRRINDVPQAERWFQKGLNVAENNTQRLNILNSVAAAYMSSKEYYDKALGAYDQVVAIDPKDPWAWHNASVILLRQKEYGRAYAYNQKALSVMQFGAAQEVEKTLKKHLNKEQAAAAPPPPGKPPAPSKSQTASKPQAQKPEQKGWFKKLLG